MAEFNSKKGFVFVSKIKNLYFVPNDISREIDSMLICSGKNPNKYIKIVKKENTLNAGIINSPIKKVIFITQEWVNMLQNNPNNNLVWNAFSGTIYHELGSYFSEYEDKLRLVNNNTIVLNVNDLKTEKEVLQWYIDMNAGGTPHSSEEIQRVKEMIEKLG